MLALVLGGMRSGKSAIAERMARDRGEPVVYLATGWASDDEMAGRIERHRQRRPPGWATVETADPEAVLHRCDGETVLVDALGSWLARLMEQEGLFADGAAPAPEAARRILARVASFAAAAAGRPGLTVVVAEEAGMGLVPVGPDGSATRQFLDLCGEAAQVLASVAAEVLLVVARRALPLPASGLSSSLVRVPSPPVSRHSSSPVEASPLSAPQLSLSQGRVPPPPPPPASGPSPSPIGASSPPALRHSSSPVRVSPRSNGDGDADPLPRSPACSAALGTVRGPGPVAPRGDSSSDPLRLHGDAMVPPGALDLAVSVVPGPPPGWLVAAIEESFARIGAYPDEGPAVRAVATRHGREPGEVLLLNGSAEAFWLLASALRPSRAVCVHPMFTEGEVALRAADRPVARVFRDPDTFALDPAAVPADADLVLVCNPNNPTGNLDAREVLERLARPGRIVVVDEAFVELCEREDESVAGSSLPGVVVLRSLTKVWSVPGLRAGYLLGPSDVVAALGACRQPWAVSGPALAAIEACASRPAAARAVAARVAAWRADLVSGLRALPGVRVWPATANFVLFEVAGGPGVRAALLEQGIAVRRADTFPGLGPGHLRVAVRAPGDNERLLSVLRSVLALPARAGERLA